MNTDDIPKLKNIRIADSAIIRSYRYDAVIEYGGNNLYHPNCITDNRKFLIDYTKVCKKIINNIDTIINVENQEHKFMVSPDLIKDADISFYINRCHIIIHKTADLTLEQAQEIINNNMYWITQAQNAIHERVLINKINKIS